MILTFLLLLLFSNGLSNRPDTSVLYNRIGLLIVFYSLISSYTTLYITYLEKGIGLYGGLFNITAITQIFQIFILIVCGIIFLTSIFYTKNKYIKKFNTMIHVILKKIKEYTNVISKVSEQLGTIPSSIKLFILSLIILDLIGFYHFSSYPLKVLFFTLIVFMQILVVIIVIINSDTKYEKSIFDKILNLIDFFFKDPLCAIFFILLLCIMSLIIRIPILDFLQVSTLNIVLIIPIFIGTLLPFFTLVYWCSMYMTYQEFKYDNFLKFLFNSINMKNIKYLIIIITFLCLCKIFIFIYFFDLTLDFSGITEARSTILNMNINKLLNPGGPNVGNNGPQVPTPGGPQVPVPDPLPNHDPAPTSATAPLLDPSIGTAEISHVSTEQFATFLEQERRNFMVNQEGRAYISDMDPKMRELGYDFRKHKGGSIYNKAAVSIRRDHPELFTYPLPGLTVVNKEFIISIRNLNYNVPI